MKYLLVKKCGAGCKGLRQQKQPQLGDSGRNRILKGTKKNKETQIQEENTEHGSQGWRQRKSWGRGIGQQCRIIYEWSRKQDQWLSPNKKKPSSGQFQDWLIQQCDDMVKGTSSFHFSLCQTHFAGFILRLALPTDHKMVAIASQESHTGNIQHGRGVSLYRISFWEWKKFSPRNPLVDQTSHIV